MRTFVEVFELLRDTQGSLSSSCFFLNNDVLVIGSTAHRWPRNDTHIHHRHCQSLRYTVKLAKRLQSIMFCYNDISRNKGNYTLIQQ